MKSESYFFVKCYASMIVCHSRYVILVCLYCVIFFSKCVCLCVYVFMPDGKNLDHSGGFSKIGSPIAKNSDVLPVENQQVRQVKIIYKVEI